MKKIYWIILILIVVLVEIGIVTISYINEDKDKIPDNYIVVFKGETSETVHTTYLYKKKKGKKIKYNYINTVSTASGYDSAEWTEKVIKKGKIKKKSDIYKKAEKNEAYSYAKFSNDDRIYSIEEFKERFK